MKRFSFVLNGNALAPVEAGNEAGARKVVVDSNSHLSVDPNDYKLTKVEIASGDGLLAENAHRYAVRDVYPKRHRTKSTNVS